MVRLLGRALLALLLLCSTPVPAHAQFFEFMDWLERLSGPTLPGMWGDIPLVCRLVDDGSLVSEETKQSILSSRKGVRSYPTRDVPARPTVFELDAETREKLIKALALAGRARTVPEEAPANAKEIDLGKLPLAQSKVRLTPFNANTKRCSPIIPAISKETLRGPAGEVKVEEKVEGIFQRSIVFGVRVGVAGVKKKFPFDGKNDLTYDPGVSDEQKEMWVFAFGPSVNWSVHPKLDLMWAVEFNRFSGPQFKTFWRPSVDAIDLAFRPFAKKGRRTCFDFFQITLRAKKYLGEFSDEDFGATPGTFFAKRESVLSLGTSVDITRMFWKRY